MTQRRSMRPVQHFEYHNSRVFQGCVIQATISAILTLDEILWYILESQAEDVVFAEGVESRYVCSFQYYILTYQKRKCDEETPECSYCIKTNQECPGYKHQFDLAWRDQNTTAKNSVQRRKKEYEAQIASEPLSLARSGSRSTANFLHASSTSPKFMEQPENHYLGFFFSTYANPPSSMEETRGFLDYLGPLYNVTAPSSTLRVSTMAVSAYLFNAWQNRGSDNPASRSLIYKLLVA